MIRKHRHASPILVLSLAALATGGCATDTGLNALERAIGNLSGENPPDSVFVLNPLYVAQQNARFSVASAPRASFAESSTESLGTNLNLSDDDCERIALGFSYTFYGVTYDRVYVCSNGNITLNTINLDRNATMPNSTTAIVAPAFANWAPDETNNVHYQVVGTEPTRRFVVTWNNLRLKRSVMNGPRSTFRAILHETSNLVELHYPSLMRETRLDHMKVGISGGPTTYIISAEGLELFDLSGTSICYTPTGPASYEETREPCPILAPPNTAPVADAAGPYEADEGSPIHFDGTMSWDAESDPLIYAWSFGDGATASEGFASHSYPDNGEYPVLLAVTDPHGLSSEAATVAVVRNVSPAVSLGSSSEVQVASFGAGAPLATILSGETATITATFADPGLGDAPWRWSVDWGNGLVDVGTTDDQSAPIVVQRRLVTAGTHTVTLVVEDKDGGRSTAFGTVVVNRVSLDIDVKPGTDDNTLNTRSYGKFWVAILTTESENPAERIDASTVVVPSVTFGGAAVDNQGRGIPRSKLEDVDGDGDVDLLLQFETQDLVRTGALGPFTRSIELRALVGDREVSGWDDVRVVR